MEVDNMLSINTMTLYHAVYLSASCAWIPVPTEHWHFRGKLSKEGFAGGLNRGK